MSKKPLAIILAFFIVFAPVYANAVLLPLLAVAASSTGRVLVGNAVKRVGQAAISRAGMASMAAGLGYMASTKSAIEQDGWTIGGGGAGGSWEDENGNIDVEIYKTDGESPALCSNTFAFGNSVVPPTSMSSFYSAMLQWAAQDTPGSTYVPAPNWQKPFDDALAKYKSIPDGVIVKTWSKLTDFTMQVKYSDRDSLKGFQANLYYRCVAGSAEPTKIYITNNQFNAYLTKNLTINQAGDLIKNIYNYDYSQHPNITINNNTTGGDSLNNDLSLNVDPNADIRVSPRLRLDIESNKVNLDNVNDTNCTKNDAGEYDNCTGEPDPEEETDPDDPNNPSPEEPQPIECSANGFYQKICDWMDWTKKDHTEPTDTNVDVTDKTSEIVIDDSRISFDDQCPTPKDINITVVGHSFSDALDYQPLCDFFIKLKPFVVGMGGISSALIIAGGVRRG